MASLVRKGRSNFWYAAFRDKDGRQHRISTKEKDSKKAMLIAEELERVAQHRIPIHKVRESWAQLVAKVYQSEVPSATVREFITQWLKLKTPDVATSTLQNYQKSAAKFLEHLGTAADRDIADIRKVQISQFRNEMQLSLAPGTANNDLRLVKAIFKAAETDGYLHEDPSKHIRSVPRQMNGKTRRPFSIPELRSILEIANPEWQSLIKFGLYTGQRLGDLAHLTWASVDLARGEIRFVTRKTGRSIVCPICDPLMEHIMGLSADSPRAPLHPKSFHKRINHLSREFVDLLIAIGLRAPFKPAVGRRRTVSDLSFHCLRVTAVSLLKDAGVPQAVVEELIGHESARMSALYTRVGAEALRKATSSLPPL